MFFIFGVTRDSKSFHLVSIGKHAWLLVATHTARAANLSFSQVAPANTKHLCCVMVLLADIQGRERWGEALSHEPNAC